MKQLTTLTLLICISATLYSSDTIVYKNKIDLTFSNPHFEYNYIPFNDILVLQLDYNRFISRSISIGGYLGVGMYDEWHVKSGDNWNSYLNYNSEYSAHYGLKSSVHILPLLFKTNIPRFDFFVTANLGFVSMFTSLAPDIIPKYGHYFDYSFVGGGSIYLSRKLGLLVEAGYKEFEYHKGFYAKYGLTCRF
jgi:hypothetical protein